MQLMSPRHKKFLAGALLGASLLSGAAPAFAAEPSKTVDVSPSLGAVTVPVPTLGSLTISPGDAASDTVRLRNTSATPLKITSQLQVVDKQLNPLDTLDSDLVFTADLGQGEYTLPARELQTSPEVEFTLAAGETRDFTLGFKFPAAAVSGRTSVFGEQHVQLAMHLRVSEIPPTPTPTPTPKPAAQTTGGLAVTGFDAAGIAALGILLAGFGGAVVIARRRTEGTAK